VTDANLVLGYLDPEFFAGGKIRLDPEAARRAIAVNIAERMALPVEEAAAGMYRVACNNMAQGVREVTIKRGYDPREFPLIAAGGAGPIHSCLICNELEIPLQIVPRSSSVLCAFGMLLSELKHDYVRTFVSRLDAIDWPRLGAVLSELRHEGESVLADEHIPPSRRRFAVRFDCRYAKQYHEVSFAVTQATLDRRDAASIARNFHAEHNRLYGYALETEGTPIELINIRLQAIGAVERREHAEEPYQRESAGHALKGRRSIYVPERTLFAEVGVYDGHALRHGNRIAGPALIETVTTTVLVSANFDCVVDRYGSFALYKKGREDLVRHCLRRAEAEALA
jgi:N-methylhydantoinase A